jgi:TetR/AcrR family transcriptional regulator, acrAB operon repressor
MWNVEMVRRTQDEAAETRNSILDAAERVFSERGVSHTSLEDIAKAAGVTRGAIYWHFRNKNELFSAMVNRVSLPIEEMVAATIEDDNSANPLVPLKKAAVDALRRTATDAQCQRVFDIVTHKCEYLEDLADVKERISHIRCGCVERTEQAMKNAVKRGFLPKDLDPHLAAVGLDAMIYGLIANWLADKSYVKLERDAEALVDRYLACLGAGRLPKARAAKKAPRRRARSKKSLH